MIIVILLVCIALIIGGCFVYGKSYSFEGAGAAMLITGIILGISALIAAGFIWTECAGVTKIAEKIKMYEEENIKIETQLAECVEQYQMYEQGVFAEVAPKDATTIVTLYPELKSNTLVQEQIETYVANNNKLKELREKQIDAEVIRWWGYFGK